MFLLARHYERVVGALRAALASSVDFELLPVQRRLDAHVDALNIAPAAGAYALKTAVDLLPMVKWIYH